MTNETIGGLVRFSEELLAGQYKYDVEITGGTISNVNIEADSGSINNTTIGLTVPAAGQFTTLNGNGDISWFGSAGAIQYTASTGYINLDTGTTQIQLDASTGVFVDGATDINGQLTTDARVIRVAIKTSAGDQTVGSSTELQIINKTVGAATQVTLPATPITGRRITVKDGKGDANTNNITVVPSAGTIDGAASSVINTAYGVREFVYNGTEWNRTV